MFDADCPDGRACEALECVPMCVEDAECGTSQVCGPGVNTVSRICRAPGEEATNNVADDPDPPTNTFTALVVESTTTSAESCTSVEPGPDLFGIAVEDDSATVAWGLVEFASVTVDGNDHANSSVLDGRAPSVDRMTGCPDTFDGNVVSLGCDDAFVVVSFLDHAGDEFAVDPARHRIRVFEWGGQCDVNAVDDTFDARLCRLGDEALAGDLSSCSVSVITDGTGEQVGPPDPI